MAVENASLLDLLEQRGTCYSKREGRRKGIWWSVSVLLLQRVVISY
jgi:hypothetical protein